LNPYGRTVTVSELAEISPTEHSAGLFYLPHLALEEEGHWFFRNEQLVTDPITLAMPLHQPIGTKDAPGDEIVLYSARRKINVNPFTGMPVNGKCQCVLELSPHTKDS
jgi:hypothetical protein